MEIADKTRVTAKTGQILHHYLDTYHVNDFSQLHVYAHFVFQLAVSYFRR